MRYLAPILIILILITGVILLFISQPQLLNEYVETQSEDKEQLTVENPTLATTTDEQKIDIEVEETEYEEPEEEVQIEPLLQQQTEEPVASVEIEIPPAEPIEAISFTDINNSTRKALVNILCSVKNSTSNVSPVSGSGIIIDEKGVILTNAHIAQYMLLENYLTDGFVDCVFRTGSPATPTYRGKLLYLSPKWITDNPETLVLQNPKGTGESDFAFILIDEHVNKSKTIPTSFPFVQMDIAETTIQRGNSVLLAGYPAGFLGGIAIQKDLYITSTIATIVEIFTFHSNTVDITSVGGSIVAQQGASGGAVVDHKGNLISMISTSSAGDTTDERELHAITLSHINRSLVEQSSISIFELLNGDLSQKTDSFESDIAPDLRQILENTLNN